MWTRISKDQFENEIQGLESEHNNGCLYYLVEGMYTYLQNGNHYYMWKEIV